MAESTHPSPALTTTKDVEPGSKPEPEKVDPVKRKAARKRLCLTWLVGIVTFLVCSGVFTFLSKSNRRELFASKDDKFLKMLYSDTPKAKGPNAHLWPNVTEQFPPSCGKIQLPSTFLWGTLSSAFQIEGAVSEDGRGPSIWDAFAMQPGKIENDDPFNTSADHYHRFQEDVQLLKSYGAKAYSFSISWPRIKPEGAMNSPVNPAGIYFYSNLTDALIKAGITPVVTLYNWDLPLALANRSSEDTRDDGWTDPQVVGHFKRYAETMFKALQGRVKHWITFNEPYSICQEGYAGDKVAPGKKTGNPFRCAHHLLLAHGEAVKSFREGKYPGKIGISLNGDFLQPYNPKDYKDIAATDRLNQATFGWFADPLFYGTYPIEMRERFGLAIPAFTMEQASMLKGSADFLAIRHFTTRWVSKVMNAAPETYAAMTYQFDWQGKPIGPATGSGWLRSVPWGLNKMLRWVDDKYKHPEIWVTNGVSVDGEDFKMDAQATNDTQRVTFLKNYMEEMCKAILTSKVNVGAHFAYAFLDGFEWNKGYTERFGITHLNLTTLERTPKDSAKWLKEFWAQAPGRGA